MSEENLVQTPAVAMETPQTPDQAPSPTPEKEQRSGAQSPWWILISVIVGFTLPICACGALAAFSIVGLAGLGAAAPTAGTGGFETGPAVAIVRVEGAIIGTDDQNFINGAGSGTIIKELRLAENDPDVQGIVLRVDSPGGTVTGSAEIHDFIRDEVTKPVVVSMYNSAASGGYYVSAPADYIFAMPSTTTGSIGVIITLFNIEELLEEFGVEALSITTGPNKSIGSPYAELTAEQREIFDALIDESYDDFVGVIADGRDMPVQEVLDLADGRIYSGRQALELGLVDELGNLEQALDKAAELGGITGDYRTIEYDRTPSFDELITGLGVTMQQSETEKMLETALEFATPVLEYRYLGN